MRCRPGEFAEAVNGTIRLLDGTGTVRWERTPSGWPTAQPLTGGPSLSGAMWGPPEFTRDGSRLVTLHQGGITLWDARTGEALRSIVSDRLTLVRSVEFSTDGRLAVLSCNSNYEGPPNHTAFVVKLDADAAPVELPWHKGAVLGASFAGPNHVATLDEANTIRLYSVRGDLEAQLTFPARVTAFSTTGALDRVVAIGDKGKIWLWEKGQQSLTTLRTEGPPVFFVGTTPNAQPWAVETGGTAHLLSGQGDPTPLALHRHDEFPDRMKARTALWLLEREDFAGAVRELQRFESDKRDLRFLIAFHYASLGGHDANADFAAYLRDRKLPTGDRAVASALLSLAEDFGDASAISLSLEFFMAWFHARQAHADLAFDDERAIAVGRGLASDMRSNDDNGTAGRLLGLMSKEWPGRWDLTEAIAETLTYEDEKAALDAVNRYLARHRSELRAWNALAWIHYEHDDAPNAKRDTEKVLIEAEKNLDPSRHETHGFLGFGYLRIDKKDAAIRHYQAALKLAPDNQDYKSRLEQLGAKSASTQH